MTVLPARLSRLALGIDSVERGIVFALIGLKQATLGLPATDPNKEAISLVNTVSIVDGVYRATLAAKVVLPFDKTLYLQTAGSVSGSVLPVSEAEIDILGTSPTEEEHFPIPEDPPEIETLEQYLVWLTLFWQQNFASPTLNLVKFTNFLANNLVLEYAIPFDYLTYLKTQNLLKAVLPQISGNEPEIPTFVGNNFLFNNSIYLAN
ncbi:hypothetical protein [Synechocystis sp. LKSZ1]|uniref:hypothetical protein n=1 Tax=Synechocystis sp. LKSZ1 TaxID=3144951 RepID=UPI00336BDD1B